MGRHEIVQAAACAAAVAAGAGVGVGIVNAMRGEIGGAPGITRSLSRIGHLVGGGMVAGIAAVSAAAALAGLIVYEGLTEADERVW